MAVTVDPDDFFTFELAAVPALDAVVDDDTFAVQVRARLGAREYLRFGVDLARPAAVVPFETLHVFASVTGLETVDRMPPVQVLDLALQIAQKTCAMFERHGPQRRTSTRARDLVDLAMIATQVDGIVAADVRGHLSAEVTRRRRNGTLDGPLPDVLALDSAQEESWRQRWLKATRNAPLTFDGAYAVAAAFLGPVLSGERIDRWSAPTQRWLTDA